MSYIKNEKLVNLPLKSLERILDYLKDEKADYEINGKPKNHIYKDIKLIQSELKRHK